MPERLMLRILTEHKGRNADADQNAWTTIWDFYGTGSDKTPNPSHLLENLVLFQLEHGGFSSLKSHELKADILFNGSSSGSYDDGQRFSWFALRVTNKSRTGDL